MPKLEDGAQLADRYTLLRRLGRGGSGQAWLAHDRSGATRVVLKFDDSGSARSRELLKREWRIGSRLMHPNIVRVFEFHDADDDAFYSQQFVGETTIAALTGADASASMRPLAMLADALRYAHGKGIVHRDIKAANVLLDSRGLPYLIDFGVAAAPGATPIEGGGSDIAASPAQRSGAEADPADDVYALGVLAFELLTGRPPSEAERRAPDVALAGGERMPSALANLLRDMLVPDGHARPDAETVARRLEEAGFPPGPAPARFVPGAASDEIVAPAGTTARRKAPPAATLRPATSTTGAGLSPRLIYGGLGVAFLLLVFVVFVLPRSIDTDDATPAVEDAVTAAEDAAETMAEDDAGETDSAAEFARRRSDTAFSENLGDEGLNDAARTKAATDEALGDLLSQLERLRYRGIERWGGQPYLDAVDVYGEGDRAYVDRNYRLAGEKYRRASRMLEPFFDRIDDVFRDTLEKAEAAFEAADPDEAVRLYDLAVAITPGNRQAEAGLARAKNLATVLDLTEQGLDFEQNLELDAARLAFQKALDLDPAWAPARRGLERIREAIRLFSFEQRMTEGFDALAGGDFASARAAFETARSLNPSSPEPVDGLLQVDQAVKLANIRRLEREAGTLVADEQWEQAIPVYEEILGIDADLQFAQQGLRTAQSRAGLHRQLAAYIEDPDSLSDQVTMQNATRLLLDVTRMDALGPRLEDQKNELSRLLKRAATPVPVAFVSDNQTEVTIFKVGRLGTFSRQELELRPGVYVAAGSRPGYRDVRVEFRVAPEIELAPVVVQCEEQI